MRLYCSPNSPYARKVRTVLREKSLDCEELFFDLADPPEEFTAANPNLRIPCLIDGEHRLFESNVIVNYLLNTYPKSAKGAPDPALATALTRSDPAHRWDDWLFLIAVETMLDSALNVFQLARTGIDDQENPYLKREHMRIQSELDWLEVRATPEQFSPDTFTIAEMNLVIALEWVDFRKPFSWRGRPNLEALVTRHANRPTLTPTRPGD